MNNDLIIMYRSLIVRIPWWAPFMLIAAHQGVDVVHLLLALTGVGLRKSRH